MKIGTLAVVWLTELQAFGRMSRTQKAMFRAT